jgi:Ser/Thr protein kinase RdoA (MazF antagonist)
VSESEPANVAYSTLSPAAVISRIRCDYDLGEVTSCEFLHRGLNDTFRAQTTDRSYALRVYRKGWRSQPQIEYELDLLLHLDRKGVRVSKPVARKDGGFLSTIDQPEGLRYAVLFTFAEGEQPGLLTEAEARSFGAAAAELHAASDSFISRNVRFGLDLSHLIDQPLNSVQPFLKHRPDDQRFLKELADTIRQKVELVQPELDHGFCHGDLHGGNAAFNDGKVTMFDFDCCGAGWRSYDIAVYRWLVHIRNQGQNWKPFLDAYQERRPLGAADVSTVPLFVAARYLWIMGLHTASVSFFGRTFINDGMYWDQWFKLIRDWEAKELNG